MQKAECSAAQCWGRCFQRYPPFLFARCGATELRLKPSAACARHAARRVPCYLRHQPQQPECRTAARAVRRLARRPGGVPGPETRIFFVLMCGSQLAWRNMGLPEIGRLRPPTSLSGATARGQARPARPEQPERPRAAYSTGGPVASGLGGSLPPPRCRRVLAARPGALRRRQRRGQSSTVRGRMSGAPSPRP